MSKKYFLKLAYMVISRIQSFSNKHTSDIISNNLQFYEGLGLLISERS